MQLNNMFGKDIISIANMDVHTIQLILKTAKNFKLFPRNSYLKNKIIGSCFFEASTRTRLSFDTAIYRMEGKIIGFSDIDTTSAGKKGESLSDTIQVISSYTDAIIIRHPCAGSAKLAADISSKPVINAGDGGNQHPTQTLLDLFTISESQGSLEELNIAMVGDLRYGRTVHSLSQALSHFNTTLFFVAPKSLSMPDSVCNFLNEKNIKFSYHENMMEILSDLDILYMTRLQKERFEPTEYHEIKQQFILKPHMLMNTKKNLKIMHPLPRVGEIDKNIDIMKQAYYFQQASNGVEIRQAIIALLLKEIL